MMRKCLENKTFQVLKKMCALPSGMPSGSIELVGEVAGPKEAEPESNVC